MIIIIKKGKYEIRNSLTLCFIPWSNIRRGAQQICQISERSQASSLGRLSELFLVNVRLEGGERS